MKNDAQQQGSLTDWLAAEIEDHGKAVEQMGVDLVVVALAVMDPDDASAAGVDPETDDPALSDADALVVAYLPQLAAHSVLGDAVRGYLNAKAVLAFLRERMEAVR